ncbi:probable plastid-lipid-associated protein 4, chloroplastic [Benincasa hispida]|uniref:probable plastid-lipid-associated protein 4, chloroplastic n=1 Tax=Benincasa hispida TaxID=102211 RepID=UPI0018FF5FC3|nr:probable plastid-lipid-associated protein 4, chloroplastic [Benincasa hispida]
MAMALSSSTLTPTIKLSPPSTSQQPRFLLRIPSNPISAAPSSNTKFLTASPSHKWRIRISFFPTFLNKGKGKGKGKDVTALKEELLQAIAPLDRGAEATPEDQEMVDQISRKLEAANPINEPLKSDLLNGKWELIYTTSRSILQTERPKFLRSRTNYQGINVDTLRAQNMESGPFFNQVTANLKPLNSRKVAVQFDTFKILGLIPVKAPGRARGELEITYLDEELRISRGDKGNLFILKMIDPSYRVPV